MPAERSGSPEPLTIATVVGSLRTQSLNRKLFDAVRQVGEPRMAFNELSISVLPHFDQDMERRPPEVVQTFRDGIEAADGLLIISPEYNYSIPGVLKNAIDWASRPSGKSVLSGKPAAIMGAAIGRSGTMRAQLHLRQVLTSINVLVMPKPELYVSFAAEKFNSRGQLSDDEICNRIHELLASFEDWIGLFPRPRDS